MVRIELSENAHERLTQLLEQVAGKKNHGITQYQIETIAWNVSYMMEPVK